MKVSLSLPHSPRLKQHTCTLSTLAFVMSGLLFTATSQAETPSHQHATKSVAHLSADGIPRLANGKPDFSGIWQSTSAGDYDLEPHSARKDAPPSAGIIDDQGTIPYLPDALKQKQQNFAARATDDPRLKCYSTGVPRSVYYPEPFQIFERDQDLTVLQQFGHSVRTIYTNGTNHPGPDDANDWWLGDSRGHWDGDTLVVDVTDFNDQTWLDRAGNFHSDALHVVEKWHFLDANTIEYKATLEDPKVYSRPWSISVILNRHREKNFQLIEDYCYTLNYDQFYPIPPATATPAAEAAASDPLVLTPGR